MENPLGQGLRGLPGPLLLTGHTGFKGTWMTFLLEHLNVPVIGYSLPPEKESLFDRAQRLGAIPEVFADICDYKALEEFIELHKPSTIIHMAAQPLVLKSYQSPRETFDVNVMGTVNVLDVAFKKNFVQAVIVVTTDKVYRNDNSGKPFIESDPLEGKDPYSASKVGTEAVISAWQQISRTVGGPKVASVRAGNVIGGGDFAEDRIIPDLIRGVQNKVAPEIRNPLSTRPWQHVLDPLTGYLQVLEALLNQMYIKSVNFGPDGDPINVETLIRIFESQFATSITKKSLTQPQSTSMEFEAQLLSLDSSIAKEYIGWNSIYSQEDAIRITAKWWHEYLLNLKTPSYLIQEEVILHQNLWHEGQIK